MTTSTSTAVKTTPHVSLGGRDIPVVLPKLHDPRLRLAAVLLTVQLLGQTVLDFKLSIAQILVTIGVCAVVDTAVTLWREQKLVWPASAMLTGNSIALLLRATGTEHGDWWSLNGIHFFVLAALIALASKYFIRPGGRHIFNPSNVALVWVLLVMWPLGVFPQYLWWGPLGMPVVLALAVVVVGAVWVLRPLRMLPMAGAFLVTLGAVVAVFAVNGHSFWAIWSPVPVDGLFYWANIVLSPEVLIFVFFMMSDPQTAPKTSQGRIVYGVGTALVAAALLSFQPTEFGVKLAILSSLTVMCALVPLIEAAVRRAQAARGAVQAASGTTTAASGAASAAEHAASPTPVLTRVAGAVRTPAVLAVLIIALVAPVGTANLADNPQLKLMEQGRSGDPNPQ